MRVKARERGKVAWRRLRIRKEAQRAGRLGDDRSWGHGGGPRLLVNDPC